MRFIKLCQVGVVILTMGIGMADVSAGGGDQKPGKGAANKAGKPDKSGKPDKAVKPAKPAKGPDVVVVIDRDGHSRVVRDYVGRASLPPGLAKRSALPPGLRNQLRETGSLPPGLQAHLVRVPADWETRLPPVPTYYHRYFGGRDLIVVDTRSGHIVLLIRDLLP